MTISSTTTLKYFSIDQTGNEESVKTSVYTIIESSDSTAPTTTASPVGGTYTSTKNVTLTCSDGGGVGCDKTYYTTDGNDPTTSSSIYSSSINITTTTTLKFFSIDLAENSESINTEVYTIQLNGGDSTAPTTTASPSGGAYITEQSVTLTCDDGGGSGCANTYYTTDGSDPTTSSSIYSSAISISSTTTLKFFSTDQASNEESINTEAYTIEASYTISCLGNSVTAGYPYEGTDDTYPAQMSDKLDQAYGEDTFEVINHGISGHRADEVYDDMVSEGWMASNNPDYVLLIVGGNDLNQGQSIATTVDDVANIVNHVTSHTNPDSSHPTLILSAMIPNKMYPPFGSAYVALYNSELESALVGGGDLENVDLWFETNWDDLYRGDLGMADPDYMADDTHPNVAGYEIVADNWVEQIETFVAQ